MATITWNQMVKDGWDLDEIKDDLADYGLSYARTEHTTRSKFVRSADVLVFVDEDGNESAWCCERLCCPVCKKNTTTYGESFGLGVYSGACDHSFLYEDWLEAR
jgi:hypothetical protein